MRQLTLFSAIAIALGACQSGDPDAPRVAPPAATSEVLAEAPPAVAPPSEPSAPTPAPELAPEAPPPTPRRSGIYATWQTFPLHHKKNGFDGTLRLLEDSRVTKAGAIREGTIYFDEPTLLLARLELVAEDGHIVEARELERPIANIIARDLRGDGRPTYLLTVDFTCGIGSYCGPITTLHEVFGPHIHDVEEVDDETNRFQPIELLQSLKTDWTLVPAASGKGFDILHVACRPSVSLWALVMGKQDQEVTFVTARSRISFEKAAWVRRWKQRREYHDVEWNEFADTRLFPAKVQGPAKS
jgi:hypothetical protein